MLFRFTSSFSHDNNCCTISLLAFSIAICNGVLFKKSVKEISLKKQRVISSKN